MPYLAKRFYICILFLEDMKLTLHCDFKYGSKTRKIPLKKINFRCTKGQVCVMAISTLSALKYMLITLERVTALKLL